MNHSILRRFTLLCLGLTVFLFGCRQSPAPTITGPWTGTLTRDNQTVATLSGNLEYKEGNDGIVYGSLAGLGEPLNVSAPMYGGQANSGNFTAVGATMSLRCISDASINVSEYKGTCTLTKNGQTTSGYILVLKRIY